MNIAIVGATGNVGRKTIEVIEQKSLPINELFLIASPKSVGQKISFKGKELKVFNLETFDFSKVDITFLLQEEKLQKNMLKKLQRIQWSLITQVFLEWTLTFL